jgi:hypothetical protein
MMNQRLNPWRLCVAPMMRPRAQPVPPFAARPSEHSPTVVRRNVARREGNVLINPRHPDFSGIVVGRPEPVVWDARLFAPR